MALLLKKDFIKKKLLGDIYSYQNIKITWLCPLKNISNIYLCTMQTNSLNFHNFLVTKSPLNTTSEAEFIMNNV